MSEPTITASIEGLSVTELDATRTALIRGGHIRNGVSIHITIDGTEPSFDDIIAETPDLVDGIDRLLAMYPDMGDDPSRSSIDYPATHVDEISIARRVANVPNRRVVLLTLDDHRGHATAMISNIAVMLGSAVGSYRKVNGDERLTLRNGSTISVVSPSISKRPIAADLVVVCESSDNYTTALHTIATKCAAAGNGSISYYDDRQTSAS